jgi:cellobiose-specific phosphotransferase system component IIA
MEYTMEEVDVKKQKEMENRLQEALAEFREQHEIQTQIHREELESLYETKVKFYIRSYCCIGY